MNKEKFEKKIDERITKIREERASLNIASAEYKFHTARIHGLFDAVSIYNNKK